MLYADAPHGHRSPRWAFNWLILLSCITCWALFLYGLLGVLVGASYVGDALRLAADLICL